jgi:hypothetical protein
VKNWLAWALIQGSNACGILVGIVLARALTPYDFGRFATMTASLTVFTALLNPLINELARAVSSSSGLSRGALVRRTLWLSLGGVILSIATCASITNSWLDQFVILLALPLSMIAWSWMNGVVIGQNQMLLLGRAQSLGALLRILIVCAMVTFAPTLVGVAMAYVLSFCVMTLVVIPSARSITRSVDGKWNTDWSLVLGFFLLAAPFSLDQTLIQRWFPSMSGDYAAVMTYAKSIMLLASPALTIAYSSALQRSSSHTPFSVFLTLAPLVIGTGGFFWIYRSVFFPLLLGPQYVDLIPHLGYAIVAISCHVISYGVAQARLARGPGRLVTILALPLLAQIVSLRTLSSPSLSDLLAIAVSVFALQLVLCVINHILLSRVCNPQ